MANNSDWRTTKLPAVQAPNTSTPPLVSQDKKSSRPRRWLWLWAIIGCLAILLAAAGAAVMWYQNSLAPMDTGSKKERRVQIVPGETVSDISKKLEEGGIIKSAFAFQLYAQITQSKNALQAGTYVLKPSQSVQTIIDHLVKGKVDTIMVTILPGSTLQDIQKSLQETYGFSPSEVEEAFTAKYDVPILADLPKDATFEGYLFPDTYRLEGNESLKSLLERSFIEMDKHVEEQKLEKAFKKQKLTLHQGLTLASIIQREVVSEQDMLQVSQIFHKRLRDGMMLGADSTFIYGAQVLGVEPTVTLKSPYNTRQVKGLPPGPIGSSGLLALKAAAHPAKGNYLYFVSGDDGTTYYSRTLKEHEEKTAKYCHENCAVFNN